MIKKDNKKEHKSWWMQFLISVIGTAIGVGLTFAVSNRIDNRKKEQARRLTAMMVIHDIDESIDRLKSMKDEMETQYNDYALMRDFLKEKLAETSVRHYINYAAYRLYAIDNIIGEWIKINDENKFLMSITDEEMENYVNSINKKGVTVKEENLIGTWQLSTSDDYKWECTFMKDHAFTMIVESSPTTNMPFAKGKLKMYYHLEGVWTVEGDSIIQIIDWQKYTVEVDGSGMTALPGRQDMLDDWLAEYRERISEIKSDDRDYPSRQARGACLDASRDKMELKTMKADEKGAMKLQVQYLKRKK